MQEFKRAISFETVGGQKIFRSAGEKNGILVVLYVGGVSLRKTKKMWLGRTARGRWQAKFQISSRPNY
jgi:hypothetical protein